jgi:hypothetical protein
MDSKPETLREKQFRVPGFEFRVKSCKPVKLETRNSNPETASMGEVPKKILGYSRE